MDKQLFEKRKEIYKSKAADIVHDLYAGTTSARDEKAAAQLIANMMTSAYLDGRDDQLEDTPNLLREALTTAKLIGKPER